MKNISPLIDEPNNLNVTDDNLSYLCQFLSEQELNHDLSGFHLVWDDVKQDKYPLIRPMVLNNSLSCLNQKKICIDSVKVDDVVYKEDLEIIKNVAAGFCAYDQLVISGIGEGGFSLDHFKKFLDQDLNLLVLKIREIHERS